jgi:hypothetical protein
VRSVMCFRRDEQVRGFAKEWFRDGGIKSSNQALQATAGRSDVHV